MSFFAVEEHMPYRPSQPPRNTYIFDNIGRCSSHYIFFSKIQPKKTIKNYYRISCVVLAANEKFKCQSQFNITTVRHHEVVYDSHGTDGAANVLFGTMWHLELLDVVHIEASPLNDCHSENIFVKVHSRSAYSNFRPKPKIKENFGSKFCVWFLFEWGKQINNYLFLFLNLIVGPNANLPKRI